MTFSVEPSGLWARTVGLARATSFELAAQVETASLIPEAQRILTYVGEYMLSSAKPVLPGQTIAYGFWGVSLHRASSELVELWEFSRDGSQVVPGVNLAARYRRDQQAICVAFNAPFEPPLMNMMSSVGFGVTEGLPVRGIRYRQQGEMSGWWLTSSAYDGTNKQMRNEHLYHITNSRQEIAEFLALPVGFCFYVAGEQRNVWFDDEVAAEP